MAQPQVDRSRAAGAPASAPAASGPDAAAPDAAGEPGQAALPAEPAAALAELYQRATAQQAAVAGANGQAAAIRIAIDAGDADGLTGAAAKAATVIDQAELVAELGHDRLEGDLAGEQRKPAWGRAHDAIAALDAAVAGAGTTVMGAMTIPGAPVGPVPADGALAPVVTARAVKMREAVIAADGLAGHAREIGGLAGKARLDGLTPIKAQLDGLGPSTRAYVVSLLRRRVAPEVIDFFEGEGTVVRRAALGPQAGAPPDVGTGGNATVESTKQAAAPTRPIDVGPPKAVRDKVGADEIVAKGDVATGDAGGSVRWGNPAKDVASGTVGGSVDLRADDGHVTFEGFKGEVGASLGPQTMKVAGGLTQVTSPPTFDGQRWVVAWTITTTASTSGGVNLDNPGSKSPAKVMGGADMKFGGTAVMGGSKIYDTQSAAQLAYLDGAFALEAARAQAVPDVTSAAAMQKGETATLSAGWEASGGPVATSAWTAVGGTVSVGGADDVKVTKGDGETVRVTYRHVDQRGGNLNLSAPGVSMAGGAGEAKVRSATVELDLATAEGKAAYAAWSQDPLHAPAPGPGVKILSRGTGEFVSKTAAVGVGTSVFGANGQNTETDGKFTERTADGAHEQTTAVGTNTDTVKGFVDPGKQTRVDALEIATVDGKTADSRFTVRTTIQMKHDAAETGRQLRKLDGEPDSTGDLLDGRSASGTSGKWTVESTYTKAQIDEFTRRVNTEGPDRIPLSHQTTAESQKLKAVLANPGATDAEKHAAMTDWMSDRGADATRDIRAAIGAPEQDVALDGDKYLTGSAGTALYEAKRQALEARLLDPALDGPAIPQLLQDVHDFYAELVAQRDHIADPNNYPELPVGLRHQIVSRIASRYAAIGALRERVVAKAAAKGQGNPNDLKVTNAEMKDVDAMRKHAAGLRSKAVDRRAKHAGALSGGRDNPRARVSDADGDRHAVVYRKADETWDRASYAMQSADKADAEMLSESLTTAHSVAKALNLATFAKDAYAQAAEHWASYAATLDMVYQRLQTIGQTEEDQSQPNHPPQISETWKGYNDVFYGTKD